MIILIAGNTHTGKTLLAQKLLKALSFPYLSIDHLKMGLIRAGLTDLTPESSEDELTEFLWPIVCEIIKTCIENKQNLIVESCYIPFNFADSFAAEYMNDIRYACLILDRGYIETHMDEIQTYAGTIENRVYDSGLTRGKLIAANENNLKMCRSYDLNYILIDGKYDVESYIESIRKIISVQEKSPK